MLIKPDGAMRGLVGKILERFEQCGLKIVGLKILQTNDAQLDKHFPQSEEWVEIMGRKTLETYSQYGLDPNESLGTSDPNEIGAKIKSWNYSYLKLGPVIAIALEGVHAIDTVRKIIGHTLPYKASPGTIRGDFSINSPVLANLVESACKNLVHASSSTAEADQELACWFSPEEFVSYERADEALMFLS